MLGLIPAELWDYTLADFGRGMADTLRPAQQSAELFIPGLGSCIPTRSARAALVTAIKSLELPSNARIGVPLYCCAVVFKAIETAGCEPRFIDVDPDTFCMSADDLKAKASQIDAVIAVHMFGNVCDIPSLREAAPGVPIIEDCALSLGSRFDASMTGSFGDAAVLSFRSGKYLSVGEGGALFSKREDIFTKCTKLMSTLHAPSRAEEMIHVVKTFLRSSLRSMPLYGLAGYALWKAYNNKVEFSDKSPVVQGHIYRTDLSLIRKRLTQLEATIKKQRSNADYLARMLNLGETMTCREKPQTFYNRYQYPLTFPSQEHRDFMAAYLYRTRIDSSKPLQDAAGVAKNYYNYKGDCPITEQLSTRTLVIPSYHTLKTNEIENVARRLNEGWAQIRLRNQKSVSGAVFDHPKRAVDVSPGFKSI